MPKGVQRVEGTNKAMGFVGVRLTDQLGKRFDITRLPRRMGR